MDTLKTSSSGALVVGGDFQGLGVLRSLAKNGVRTFLIDWSPCIGKYSRFTNGFAACPPVEQEDAFVEFLKELAIGEQFEGWVVYPNNDETVRLLSKHKNELGRLYKLPVTDWEQTKLFYDKKYTYRLAASLGIPIPATFYPTNVEDLTSLELDYPVIIKPSVRDRFYALTKRKAVRADSLAELIDRYRWVSSIVPAEQVLIQELIPAKPENLFSVGVLFKHGRVLAKVMARRARQHPMDFGHATTFAETIHLPELSEPTERILSAIGFYGMAEVEYMQDPRDSRFKLLEINGRVWGWHSLARAAGVDLPYLLYLDMTGRGSVTNGGFTEGVKWLRPITDIPTAGLEILKARMRLSDYLASLAGVKEIAPPVSWDDPLPFLLEFLMIPYLWKKRGF